MQQVKQESVDDDNDAVVPQKQVRFAEPQMSVTTVAPDALTVVPMPPPPVPRKPKKSTGVSKRPRDVFIEDAAQNSDLLTKASEPVGKVLKRAEGDESESVSAQNVFGMDTYPMTQRFVVQAMLRSANFEEGGAERDAQNVRAALVHAQQRQLGVNPAAYTNYMIRMVDAERARTTGPDGVTLLDATPYSDSTVSAFASNFIAGAIECGPDTNAHEHADAKMRAASTPLTMDYMKSYMRSAHPTDFACASREMCVGMNLLDEHNNPLPPTIWRVFWFAHELPSVIEEPDKYAAIAKSRYCIGCKIEKGNKCQINAASRNNRVAPDHLATDFHVFGDIPGEFPMIALRGRGTNGHYGLLQCIPLWSKVGWSATPDGQRANCYIYEWNIPRYPIPRAWYERDLVGKQRGF